MLTLGLWAVVALLAFTSPIDSRAIQNDFYPGPYQPGMPPGMPGMPPAYNNIQYSQPIPGVMNAYTPIMNPMNANMNMGYMEPSANMPLLGPNFSGMDQAPFVQQTAQQDEEFDTLVRAGGPYSGAYALESILDDKDIIGYMSIPNQLEDIPLVSPGHDESEHARLLHEPSQPGHNFGTHSVFSTGNDNGMEDDGDSSASSLYHDSLVDNSIHALARIGTQHDEDVHRHVHPDEISRMEMDMAMPLNDQKGFEVNADQITNKLNNQVGYDLSPDKSTHPHRISEGMPYEVLLKGGSYYDTATRHKYMSASTALTMGAIMGVVFLLCGFILAIIYCKGVWAIWDFFLCLIGFSCLLPLPPPPPDLMCGHKGSCCKCTKPPKGPKYPNVLRDMYCKPEPIKKTWVDNPDDAGDNN